MPRRAIDTSIWNDDRFAACSPEAKLTYVRLVTGDDTGPAGATRVHSRRLAADTGLSTKRVDRAVDELAETGLVRRYDGGWLWMPTWIRYQVAGPNFCRAVRRQAKECPEALKKAIGRALDEHAPQKAADTNATGNDATSSVDVEGSPDAQETVAEPSGNRSGGGTGPGPGPGQTFGLSVLVRDGSAVAGAEGAGSAVPEGNGSSPPSVQVLSEPRPDEDPESNPVTLDALAELAPDSEVVAALRRLRARSRMESV
jgi:hypothetical protein